MGEAVEVILGLVGDVEKLGESGCNDAVDDAKDESPINAVESLAGFVEDEEWWLFDESAGDEEEALLPEAQRAERLGGERGHADDFEPLAGNLELGRVGFLVKADTVKESRNDNREGIGADAILLVEGGGNDAEVVFDVPDRFALAPAHSHYRNVVGITLGVVTADEVDECGFSAAVGPADFPMMPTFNEPVEGGNDFAATMYHGDLLHRNEGSGPGGGSDGGIAGREGVDFAIELHELSEGGIIFDFVFGAGEDAFVLIGAGEMRGEAIEIAEAIGDDDEGDGLGILPEKVGEMGPELLVETVEWFVEDEEIGRKNERSCQHEAAAFSGREQAESTVGEIGEAEFVNEIIEWRRVVRLNFVDEFEDGSARVDFVEELAVVFTDFAGKERVFEFEGKMPDLRKGGGALPGREAIALSEHVAEMRFAAGIASDDAPGFSGGNSELVKLHASARGRRVFEGDGGHALTGFRLERPGLESHEVGNKGERDGAGGAVPVLGENEFGLAVVFVAFFLIIDIVDLSIEESNHVGVLLNGAGFTEVGHAWNAEGGAGTAFRSPVELGENDDRDTEFLGESFEAAGDFRDLTFTGIGSLLGGRSHELKVIDRDHADAFVSMFTTGFGPEVVDGNACGVVDEEFRGRNLTGGFLDAFEVGFVGRVALHEFGELKARAGEDEALHNLHRGHFAREDHGGLAGGDGDVFDNVHHERGLTHRRTGCDDEHIGCLESVGHLIEVRIAGGEAGDAAVAGEELLEILHDLDDGFFHADFDVGFGSFANLEDLLLNFIEEVDDVLGVIVCGGDRLGAGLDDVAENKLLFNDRKVGIEVCSSGSVGVNFGEGRWSADGVEEIAVDQVLGQREKLDGFSFLEMGGEDGIKLAVGRDVEVGGRELSLDGAPDVFLGILQHGAEKAFFGSHRMRWRSQRIVLFLFPAVLKIGAILIEFFEGWFVVSHRSGRSMLWNAGAMQWPEMVSGRLQRIAVNNSTD